MKAKRSDKQRSAVFEKFNNKSPMLTLFCLKPIVATGAKHEASAKKHQAMLDKAKRKHNRKIKAWLKAKAKSIFKVK